MRAYLWVMVTQPQHYTLTHFTSHPHTPTPSHTFIPHLTPTLSYTFPYTLTHSTSHLQSHTPYTLTPHTYTLIHLPFTPSHTLPFTYTLTHHPHTLHPYAPLTPYTLTHSHPQLFFYTSSSFLWCSQIFSKVTASLKAPHV